MVNLVVVNFILFIWIFFSIESVKRYKYEIVIYILTKDSQEIYYILLGSQHILKNKAESQGWAGFERKKENPTGNDRNFVEPQGESKLKICH